MDHINTIKTDVMARLTDYYTLSPRRLAPRSFALLSVFAISVIILLFPILKIHEVHQARTPDPKSDAAPVVTVQDTLDYLINFPLAPTEFGEMGQRVQLLSHRFEVMEKGRGSLNPSQAHAVRIFGAFNSCSRSCFRAHNMS